MNLQLKDRVAGSGKLFTIIGTVLGAAITGAAQYYQTSGGNLSGWQGYAVSGGAAAVVATGALIKGKKVDSENDCSL